MIKYSKIVSKILGTLMFFIVFFSVLFYNNNFPPSFTLLFERALLAFMTAAIVWFWTMIACDFLFKGIIEEIEDYGIEGILEGGILQRFQMLRAKFMPGGEYMPFVKVKVEKSKEKDSEKNKKREEKEMKE